MINNFITISICLLTVLALFGCSKKPEETMTSGAKPASEPMTEAVAAGPATITDKEIAVSDVKDFYYTYENINFNAFYQRYRIYVENGKHMFFHDTREVKDDYGPATEENRTLFGEFELTDQEWGALMDLLADGSVKNREESIESGNSGPWMFMYLEDGTEYEYDFASYDARLKFEDYCASLAEK